MHRSEGRFENRVDAGRQLATALEKLDLEDPVVLALPRGGVPVALEVALRLQAPLDLVMVRKIGMPGQRELALGAVVDGSDPQIVINEDVFGFSGLTGAEIQHLAARELTEIDRRKQRYGLADRVRPELSNKTLILVDDGVATGATMFASIKALKLKSPKELIVAVPVAPRDTVERLEAEGLRVVCLTTPEPFRAVGLHYHDFSQLHDEDVSACLQHGINRQ